MDYLGIRPPQTNVPLIELDAIDGESVDLYNEASLSKVCLDERSLAFEFLAADESRVVVRFHSVRDLRVGQAQGWDPREFLHLDHILIREEGPWPQVVVKPGSTDDYGWVSGS